MPINVNYNYNYINHATFEAYQKYTFVLNQLFLEISKIYKRILTPLVAMRPGKRPLVNNNPNIGNMFYKDYFDKKATI